jgi:hypothetical protein
MRIKKNSETQGIPVMGNANETYTKVKSSTRIGCGSLSFNLIITVLYLFLLYSGLICLNFYFNGPDFLNFIIIGLLILHSVKEILNLLNSYFKSEDLSKIINNFEEINDILEVDDFVNDGTLDFEEE